jgi:hypothetical protein
VAMNARTQHHGTEDRSAHAPTGGARQADALHEPPVGPLSALVKLLARQAAREAFRTAPRKGDRQ